VKLDTCILVFQTENANESARRFDETGVGHSGVNKVQQPSQLVPMGVVEIDREDVPEGRLAVAEFPVSEAPEAQRFLQHPNGAVDLVESILCVPDAEIETYVKRYQRYLGRVAQRDGMAHIFDLQGSYVKLIPENRLGELLPGETVQALPAFVAYAVAVRDPGSTRRLLESNGLVVRDTSAGDIFVPAQAALGAAVIFRQAQ
jgi:hypothetical protein